MIDFYLKRHAAQLLYGCVAVVRGGFCGFSDAYNGGNFARSHSRMGENAPHRSRKQQRIVVIRLE